MSIKINGTTVASNGKSAYLYAVAGGFQGSETDFARKLNNDNIEYIHLFCSSLEAGDFSQTNIVPTTQVLECINNNKTVLLDVKCGADQRKLGFLSWVTETGGSSADIGYKCVLIDESSIYTFTFYFTGWFKSMVKEKIATEDYVTKAIDGTINAVY